MTLKPISADTISKICAGQVIVDLTTAVKELIENSIDAEATTIEVRFRDHGLASFSVIDNGHGVPESNYEALCLKHHTSKLSSFADLSNVATFGFRGEALSSLCAIAGEVSVVTTTAEAEPEAAQLSFDSHGVMTGKKMAARQRGTTVTVSGMFARWPVRLRELTRNIKKEYAKCLALLEAYAIIVPGVRFTVSNQSAKAGAGNSGGGGGGGGGQQIAIQSMGSQRRIDRIASVLGVKMRTVLQEFEFDLASHPSMEQARKSYERAFSEAAYDEMVDQTEATDDVAVPNDSKVPFTLRLSGHISRNAAGCGRSSNDRQYFFVNGRPCGQEKLQRAINEEYRSAGGSGSNTSGSANSGVSQYPIVVADLQINRDGYDVNVSPDKRTIMLHWESAVVEAARACMAEFLAAPSVILPTASQSLKTFLTPAPRSQQQQQQLTSQPEKRVLVSAPAESQFTAPSPPVSLMSTISFDANLVEDSEPVIHESINVESGMVESAKEASKSGDYVHTLEAPLPSMEEPDVALVPKPSSASSTIMDIEAESSAAPAPLHSMSRPVVNSPSRPQPQQLQQLQQQTRLSPPKPEIKSKTSTSKPATTKAAATKITGQPSAVPKNRLLSCYGQVRTVAVAESRTLASYSPRLSLNRINSMLEEEDDENAKIPAAASISNVDDVDAAANALSLVLSKSDFGMMSVLGQFNQGFIITRLGQELFIVDQHAADEKRNFEELQTNAVISSQSLLKPQPLKLSAAEEHLAMEHADTFARNGFGVKIDESAEPGHRVKLVSQPHVDHVMFNMTDLIEIIEQLNSGAPAGSVRCARARKMFASRACRMSTMIGDPLNMQNMRKIVTSLGRLDNPWNCPHGRPTVRHLANIANVTSTQAGRDVQKQAVDEGWQPEPTKARYRCRPLSLKGSLSHC